MSTFYLAGRDSALTWLPGQPVVGPPLFYEEWQAREWLRGWNSGVCAR